MAEQRLNFRRPGVVPKQLVGEVDLRPLDLGQARDIVVPGQAVDLVHQGAGRRAQGVVQGQ